MTSSRDSAYSGDRRVSSSALAPQVIAEVAVEFREMREMRLLEEHYLKEDVESLMDGLLAILRTDLKRNMQNMCHSTVLLIKQLLEQACLALHIAYISPA